MNIRPLSPEASAAAINYWNSAVKLKGSKVGDNFKLSADGKIVRDERAIEARLDVSTRLQRRRSKKIRVKPVDAFRV